MLKGTAATTLFHFGKADMDTKADPLPWWRHAADVPMNERQWFSLKEIIHEFEKIKYVQQDKDKTASEMWRFLRVEIDKGGLSDMFLVNEGGRESPISAADLNKLERIFNANGIAAAYPNRIRISREAAVRFFRSFHQNLPDEWLSMSPSALANDEATRRPPHLSQICEEVAARVGWLVTSKPAWRCASEFYPASIYPDLEEDSFTAAWRKHSRPQKDAAKGKGNAADKKSGKSDF